MDHQVGTASGAPPRNAPAPFAPLVPRRSARDAAGTAPRREAKQRATQTVNAGDTALTARRRLVLALVAELLIGVVAGLVAANAVMRPGCSLLPVAVPPDNPSGLNVPISAEQACAILGRSVHVPVLPSGVRIVAVSASAGQPFGAPRMVRMTFAKGERNVATLDLASTRDVRIFFHFPVTERVDGAPADIEVTHVVAAHYDDVGYHWMRDEILYTLHVALVDGITRQDADAMAASAR